MVAQSNSTGGFSEAVDGLNNQPDDGLNNQPEDQNNAVNDSLIQPSEVEQDGNKQLNQSDSRKNESPQEDNEVRTINRNKIDQEHVSFQHPDGILIENSLTNNLSDEPNKVLTQVPDEAVLNQILSDDG